MPGYFSQVLQGALSPVMDPLKGSLSSAQQAAGLNLYDPQTLMTLQTIFGPLFNQQRSGFTQSFGGQLNRSVSDAGNTAVASAYSRGLANPGAFRRGAESSVRGQFLPGYFSGLQGLEENQLRSLLSAMSASQEFKQRGLFGLSGSQFNVAELQERARQFNEQMANQPGFWENLLGGVFGAAGTIGGALLGGPAGAAAGSQLGNVPGWTGFTRRWG